MKRMAWSALHILGTALFLAVMLSRVAQAGAPTEDDVADLAIGAFAEACPWPRQTASDVEARMLRFASERGFADLPFALDFYDTTLEQTAADVTPGTTRRCEVAFPGIHTEPATEALQILMATPPVFGQPIPLPITHSPMPGTYFIEGRQLNARVAAVVHVGTRENATGLETFINVERLLPSAPQSN